MKNTKKFLSLFLCLILTFGFISVHKEGIKANALSETEQNNLQDDLYTNLSFDYTDETLTVTGSGAIPDPNKSSVRPLDKYKDTTTVIIIKSGVNIIEENAFEGFTNLTRLMIEDCLTIKDKAFGDSDKLSFVVFDELMDLEGNPFSEVPEHINIFTKDGAPIQGNLAENIFPYGYVDKEGYVRIYNGPIFLNAYDLFDLFAIICADYKNVNHIVTDGIACEDLPLYTYNSETGELSEITELPILAATLKVKVINDGNIEQISLNDFCERAANGTLDEFKITIESPFIEDEILDTDVSINSFKDIVEYALKWIVNLFNQLFSFFTKLF